MAAIGLHAMPHCGTRPAATPLRVPQLHRIQLEVASDAALELDRRRCHRRSHHRLRLAATAGAAEEALAWAAAGDGEEEDDSYLGPAAKSTLRMLEWDRLCEQVKHILVPLHPSAFCAIGVGAMPERFGSSPHMPAPRAHPLPPVQVATFAQTTLGQRACAGMVPPPTALLSQRALGDTAAVDALEAEFAADLDFGGVQTAQVCWRRTGLYCLCIVNLHVLWVLPPPHPLSPPPPRWLLSSQCGQALARAAKGGVLTGPALQAVASLLLGAAKLQRTVRAAAREAEATGYTGLQPVTALFKVCWGGGGGGGQRVCSAGDDVLFVVWFYCVSVFL